MQLTLDLIEEAAPTRAAQLMRILSEDVLQALGADTLPAGDGRRLVWCHPSGAKITIAAERSPDDDTRGPGFLAEIVGAGAHIAGGFVLFDAAAADHLRKLIEGPTK